MVGHAPRDPRCHRWIVEVVDAGATPVPAHPAPVRPIRVPVVSGANMQRDRCQGFDLNAYGLAQAVGQLNPGVRRMPGPGCVADVSPRPAELLNAAIWPD